MRGLCRPTGISASMPTMRVAWTSASLPRISSMSTPRFLLAAVLLAIFSSGVWTWALQPEPVSDFQRYLDRATSIAAGHGFHEDGMPTAYEPVGYPAFLALLIRVFGKDTSTLQLVQVVLFAATLPLLYHLFSTLSRNVPANRLSLLGVAVLPAEFSYPALISDTTLFQLLIYAGLWLQLGSPRRPILSGLCFGLATLTRPYAAALPLLASLSEVSRGSWISRFRQLFAIYGVLLAVLAPWTWRNYQRFDAFIPVATNGGVNLLIGSGDHATGAYTTEPLQALNRLNIQSEAERDRTALRMALQAMHREPVRVLSLAPRKLAYMFLDGFQPLRWNLRGAGLDSSPRSAYALILTALFQATHMFVMIGFVGTCLLSWRRRGPSLVNPRFGPLLFAFLALLAVIAFGNPRFAQPVLPIWCLYTALLLTWLVSRRFASRTLA